MSHDEAVKNDATERYVLEEMTDEERESFEEHYFDCAVCAEDVRAAIALRDQMAAEVVKSEPAVVPFQPRRRSMPAWLAAAASLVVGVLTMQFTFVGPLQTTVAELRQPRVPAMYRLDGFRGAGEQQLPSSRAANMLEVVIPPDATPLYCRIVDARGAIRYSLPVPAELAKDYIRVEIPPGTLQPGNYTLRVDGQQLAIAQYNFSVR
jgi:hypothetical protein